MPKRVFVDFQHLCCWQNLNQAFYQAAKGHRRKRDVAEYSLQLERNIGKLRNQLLGRRFQFDDLRTFNIRDPKPRKISAPTFRDRIVHHALYNLIAPVLEKSMIDLSFACRKGKGLLQAVKKAQAYSRRFRVFAKFDIRRYFHSISHDRLMQDLERRIQSDEVLELIEVLLESYADRPGVGLPIGALTSQLFANYFLSFADRWLLNQSEVRGLVRYMDDSVCWFDSLDSAKKTRDEYEELLSLHLDLTLKNPVLINRTRAGLPFGGYRIFPGTIKLSRRRMARFHLSLAKFERAYLSGDHNGLQLQNGYSCAHAIVFQADSIGWLKTQQRMLRIDEV